MRRQEEKDDLDDAALLGEPEQLQKISVLVVGSGGREHALAWKIKQSPLVEKIFCAPGNAGISKIAECVPIQADDIAGLADFAEKNSVGLTVVGPEAALVKGIVDEFEKRELAVFGPSQQAAMLEGSKSFARQLMKEYGIPSPWFESFTEKEAALAFLREKGAPIVVKADGLAAGKGVIVCQTIGEAEQAIERILVKKEFGEAGNKAIVEEFLSGEEASFLVFSDGKTAKPMVASQDHKRAFDNDAGPNTGGMGAYSPAPIVDEKMEETVMEDIILPTINAMRFEDKEYKGVLYAGLMIDAGGNPKVLEFNCRFGDPETQVILPRLQGDLVAIMQSCIAGDLSEQKIKWKKDAATCVVLASGGYPEKYDKGFPISGLEEAEKIPNAVVFHAGTKLDGVNTLTNGGRVLGVTALGKTVKQSIENAYAAASKISFEKMHYRKDIGKKALERQ